MNAIFILVIKMYLTSPLGAGIQKNHGASQFQTSSFLCERLLGGPTHHEGLAIDRTFDSSKKSCPNPVHKYILPYWLGLKGRQIFLDLTAKLFIC